MFGVISLLLARWGIIPPPFTYDEAHDKRDPTGVDRTLPYSILASFTFLVPLVFFVPVILWSGMFGETGLFSGVELTHAEIIAALIAQPVEIFQADSHAGIVWPDGFLSKIGMIFVYIVVAYSIVMSAMYIVLRRAVEFHYRGANRQEKARSA